MPFSKYVATCLAVLAVTLLTKGSLAKSINRNLNEVELVAAEERAADERAKKEAYDYEFEKRAIGQGGHDISMAELDRALNEMMMAYSGGKQGDDHMMMKKEAMNGLVNKFVRDLHAINGHYDTAAVTAEREDERPSKFHSFLSGKDDLRREASKRSLAARLAIISRLFEDRERRNVRNAPSARLRNFLSGKK